VQFVSLSFYFWVLAAVCIYYALPGRYRIPFLLLISAAFYVALNPAYLSLLAFETVAVFCIGLGLRRNSSDVSRSVLLSCALALVVGSLVAFKAGGALKGWLLPLGISYYTFKLISYTIEVYWHSSAAVESLTDFSLYIAFGPQMISGPIQRPYDFWPQLEDVRAGRGDPETIEGGMRLILSGLLIKMLVGDRLADFIAVVDTNPASYARRVVTTSTLAYLAQLYADFAGYTNIALGLGQLFGIKGPANFNAPFSAPNIQQYWRRWHMSLTTWLTDYVFMPLRMSTRNWGNTGLIATLMVTFALIGLWHGFSSTFLIFGLIHGVFMSFSALTLGFRDRMAESLSPAMHKLRAAFGIVCTYLLVTFSQIWFQAPNTPAAWTRLKQILAFAPSGTLSLTDIPSNVSVPVYICLPVALYLGAGAPGLRRLWMPVSRFVPEWSVYGIGILMLSLLNTDSGSKFIYGQF
jgi:alginate O-acetyltransferase complex protein AlgI